MWLLALRSTRLGVYMPTKGAGRDPRTQTLGSTCSMWHVRRCAPGLSGDGGVGGRGLIGSGDAVRPCSALEQNMSQVDVAKLPCASHGHGRIANNRQSHAQAAPVAKGTTRGSAPATTVRAEQIDFTAFAVPIASVPLQQQSRHGCGYEWSARH